jgi:O-antigen/teichoic acid export membrane protein
MLLEVAAKAFGPLRTIYGRVRSNDVLRHGVLVLAATTVLNAGAFMFHAFVSRRLGVAAYGSLYAVVSLALFASFPSGIFNTVISKVAAELRALDDPAHLRALTATVCNVFAATLLAYVAAGFALSGTIGEFMRIESWEVSLAFAMAGSVLFVLALRAIAQGIQDFRFFSAALVIDGGLRCTLGATLAAGSFGIAGGLLGFFAGSILSGGFTLWRLWAQFRTAARTRFRIDLRRVYSTTIGATALTASTAILSYADVLVVKHFFAEHDAGIYAATSLGGKILFFLVAFAPMVVIPKAVDSHSRGQNPLVALRGAMLMVIALSAAGLVAFVLGGSIILRLLVGGDYGEAAPLLPWYGLAMSLLAIANVVASYSIALHRFAFSLPLVAVAIAEIAAIYFYHPSLHSVVLFLVLGNAAAVLAVSLALAIRSASARPHSE